MSSNNKQQRPISFRSSHPRIASTVASVETITTTLSLRRTTQLLCFSSFFFPLRQENFTALRMETTCRACNDSYVNGVADAGTSVEVFHPHEKRIIS